MSLDDELLSRTRELWERHYGRSLSDEDVREIASNVAAFFTLLLSWDRPETAAGEGDAASKARDDEAA